MLTSSPPINASEPASQQGSARVCAGYMLRKIAEMLTFVDHSEPTTVSVQGPFDGYWTNCQVVQGGQLAFSNRAIVGDFPDTNFDCFTYEKMHPSASMLNPKSQP